MTKQLTTSQKSSVTIINLNLHSSHIAKYALLLLYIAVYLAVFLSYIPLTIKMIILLILTTIILLHHAQKPPPITHLEASADGRIYLVDQQDTIHRINQLRFKYIFCYYVVMNTDHAIYKNLYIFRDMLTASDFQKLCAYATRYSLDI